MTEATDQQKSDHVFAICERAYHIALQSKISRLKEKGRGKDIGDKLQVWHRRQAKKDVARLLFPALQKAAEILSCNSGDGFNKLVEAILIGSLPKPRGRPGAIRGILGRAMAEANQKPVISLRERLNGDLEFYRRVEGERLKLLAKTHKVTEDKMRFRLSKHPESVNDVTVREAIDEVLKIDAFWSARFSGKRTAQYNCYNRGKRTVRRQVPLESTSASSIMTAYSCLHL